MSDEQQHKPDDAPDEALVQATTDHVTAMLSSPPDDEALAAIRSNVERHLKLAAKLRAHPLRNADEPDFVFRPYRAEG